MAYEPFLIANMRHGLELGIKPWLAPSDAFSELVNAYLDHGVLYKRAGYVPFGQLGRNDLEILGLGSGNLIPNPGFETGALEPWVLTETPPADATVTVEASGACEGGYRAAVVVADPGVAETDLLLGTGKFALVNAVLYRLNFQGRSDTEESRMVKVRLSDGAVTIFEDYAEIFPSSWGCMEFSQVFTAAGILNPEDCELQILWGGMGAVPFQVDGFSLEVIGWSGTLTEIPVIPGSVSFGAGSEGFSDDGYGNLAGSEGGVGEINYATGEFWFECADPPEINAPLTITYNREEVTNPCMGIFNYTNSGGAQDLLAFDTKRVLKYNESTDKFDDISGKDLFTGLDYEYFWMTNWLNKGFITNGRDQIRLFDGLELSLLNIDLSEPPDGANDLNSAYLIFPFKDRLIFLRTSEFGSLYPQRARWTKVGKYDESDPLAYVDAPTHEWIIGAAFLRNELVVFFERSVWLLRYTGDSRLPFRWQRVATNEGLMAKMGLMDFANELVGIGPTQLFGTDGVETYDLDEKVPNLIMSMNQGGLEFCYATALDEMSQMWLSYPSSGQDRPDRVLALNYAEKSFATHKLPHLVTGYYQENYDLTWEEIDQPWDEIEWSWDDRRLQAGFPAVLGGDAQGRVFKLNSGGSDNGEPIEMIAKGGRWNPYIKEGQKARLGYVDFLVDRDPYCQLQVDYYLDQETTPYMSEVITLDDGSGKEKIWVRSFVGCEGVFHQLRLYNNAIDQSIVVHAIMPWFERAGSIN